MLTYKTILTQPEQKSTSDVDILIKFEKGKITFDNYMDLKFFLEDLFKGKVDLVMQDAIRPDLKPHIMGSVKYAASSGFISQRHGKRLN